MSIGEGNWNLEILGPKGKRGGIKTLVVFERAALPTPKGAGGSSAAWSAAAAACCWSSASMPRRTAWG